MKRTAPMWAKPLKPSEHLGLSTSAVDAFAAAGVGRAAAARRFHRRPSEASESSWRRVAATALGASVTDEGFQQRHATHCRPTPAPGGWHRPQGAAFSVRADEARIPTIEPATKPGARNPKAAGHG